jgi:hypothetical protein
MIEAKKSEIARLPKPGSFFFVKERTMTDDKNKFHTSASTRSVHVGERRHKPYHSLIDPIVPTSTYIFDSYEDICQFTQDKNNAISTDRLEYGRYGNPTVRAVEERLAALEGGEEALLESARQAKEIIDHSYKPCTCSQSAIIRLYSIFRHLISFKSRRNWMRLSRTSSI